MHTILLSAASWMIVCFILTLALSSDPILDDLSVDCGSSGSSAAVDGRKWIGDKHPNFTIEGSSTTSSVKRDLLTSVGTVPYRTARISRSQFSYIFQLSPGQKFVSLHFSPASYHGFKKYKDLFTVEAGPFTLMKKFSASITAEALGLNSFVKEFCIILEENQPLNLSFYPASVNGQSLNFFAFVNGIEIISVHESISYCHTGETGVQVVGEKSVVYIDKSSALEMVYRQNLKKDPVSLNDIRGRFGMQSKIIHTNLNNITWRIPVDMGFRYLVRLHFCEIGLKMAKTIDESFLVFIDHMIVNSGAEIFRDVEHKHSMLYKNYMVIAKGRKRDGKRDILISLQSKGEFIYRHGPLEGLEIFKLNNPDNSLASSNPLPSTRDSQFLAIRYLQPVFGNRYFLPNVFIVVICLVCIIVHLLRQTCEIILPEDENQPSTRALRLCRHFSLAEIRTATKNFSRALFIGKGGFGKVYKGLIDNGRHIVAIKRLKPGSKQGKREFRKEIETLSELRHSNLVPLIGYCKEQGEMILVYAYMPNGTLADHLYKLARKKRNYSFLSWEDRLKICIGAGRGLDYLHTGHGVIHRDVKASNILLDETFVAKVSDFGLAKTEKERKLQSHDSSNPRGTFGYFDPDYFRTCKPTMKSDTYSFGVVLLEVICGRPALDPLLEEYQKSLTTWALDNISRGEVDQIVDPSLRGEISPNSLDAFVGIVEKCLHDEPKRRPTIAHVIIQLEFALEQHINKSLVPNDIASVADILLCTGKSQHESMKPLFSHEITGGYDAVPNANIMSMSTLDQTVASSYTRYFTSGLKEQANSRMLDTTPPHEKKDGKKTIVQRLSRLFPWDTTAWKRAKELKKKDFGGMLTSDAASMSEDNRKMASATGGGHDLSSTSNFRIFSLSELKAATKNFRPDTVVGRGGFGTVYKGYLEKKLRERQGSGSIIANQGLNEWLFGTVYKGYLEKKSRERQGSGSIIAIKRLIPESNQGFNEWLTEVTFLGKLSHPNLVKLFGYCSENKELLLVYEFMEGGSLDRHLYRRSNAVQPLPWNIRLQIITGAARGLAYLHTIPVIFRDFKPPNILLDGSYNVKLSDFGLAKSGPSEAYSHITTQVKGTMGYTAPEYLLTGHLTVKSDVYGFGVILMEMLTGLRAIDSSRPTRQKNLIEWIRPHSNRRLDVKQIMDSRLEGNYPHKSAKELYLLAGNCLKYAAKARPSMEKVVETLERMLMGVDKPVDEPGAQSINQAVDEPGAQSINQAADTHRQYTKTSFYSRKHVSF